MTKPQPYPPTRSCFVKIEGRRIERDMPCMWYVSALHYQDNATYQAKTKPQPHMTICLLLTSLSRTVICYAQLDWSQLV